MASLGHQSLPPTDLGRVNEEMASPGGRIPLNNRKKCLAAEFELIMSNSQEFERGRILSLKEGGWENRSSYGSKRCGRRCWKERVDNAALSVIMVAVDLGR
ncbi:hypothetical protein TNCV_3881711 [Trichonephila clavipes]|nr:hypothetical protein TNCV_3881711 [Trichonephila clavipes]